MHVKNYFTAHSSGLNDVQKFSPFAVHCIELFSRNKSIRVYTSPAGKLVTLISRINTVLRIAAILFSINRYGQPSGCHFNLCCDIDPFFIIPYTIPFTFLSSEHILHYRFQACSIMSMFRVV